MIHKLGLFLQNFPAVIGADSSGEIEEVGEDVVGFKKGDRVFVSVSSPHSIHLIK